MALSIIKEKLENLQQRLLRLTTVNHLLNTNFQRRELDRFRVIDELSPEEIFAIDRCQNSEKQLVPSERAREVSKYLGWQKCSKRASDYIKKSLEEASNNVEI